MTDRSRNLDEYVNYVRRKLRSDSDNMIVIAGEEGSGRATWRCSYATPSVMRRSGSRSIWRMMRPDGSIWLRMPSIRQHTGR